MVDPSTTWRLTDDDGYAAFIRRADGRIVGSVRTSNDEERADARLAAAAFELFNALELLMPPQCPIVTHHRPNCDFCRALRAIKKAKGNSG